MWAECGRTGMAKKQCLVSFSVIRVWWQLVTMVSYSPMFLELTHHHVPSYEQMGCIQPYKDNEIAVNPAETKPRIWPLCRVRETISRRWDTSWWSFRYLPVFPTSFFPRRPREVQRNNTKSKKKVSKKLVCVKLQPPPPPQFSFAILNSSFHGGIGIIPSCEIPTSSFQRYSGGIYTTDRWYEVHRWCNWGYLSPLWSVITVLKGITDHHGAAYQFLLFSIHVLMF